MQEVESKKRQEQSSWLKFLSEDNREAVHAVMRSIGDEMQKEHERCAKLSPGYGEIAAGAAHKDHALRASAAEHFLRQLRHGLDPLQASEAAQRESTLDVRNHNRERKDTNWQRWEQCQHWYVVGLQRRVEEALR